MSDSTDVPILARVYAATVQRVQCDLRQFNSNAAFILSCENIRKIYVWIGNAASADDNTVAETVAFDILREDFLNVGELETIREDHEPLLSLEGMLAQLFMSVDDYRQQGAFRSNRVDNCALTLSVIERKNENEYALRSVAHSAANRTGTVPMLPFLSVVDRKTIAVLATGNQYDIWFAEAVSRREKMAVKAFIIETAMAKVPSKQRGLEAVTFDRSLCLVGQDRPTALFRANFTPTTRYLATSNMKTRPSIARKSLNATKGSNQKCSDCVGDAILRLLGISSKPSPAAASGPDSGDFSNRSDYDDDTRSTTSHGSSLFCSTEALQSAFSGGSSSSQSSPSSSSSSGSRNHAGSDSNGGSNKDSVYLKLQRLVSKTEIRFINPPRRNTKLLVLDLDHTLMDFSSRFDYMAEQLKRPYLDQFLAKAYVYYDIVVWSQTNFKWLELKLTELGMLNRKDYKICFALDKSTMLTVKQQYVKPLEIIWAKCGPSLGWGPHNTIHVDDLERNFELNKQCGVLISPFHLKPVLPYGGGGGGAAVDADGNSVLDGTAVTPSMAPPNGLSNGHSNSSSSSPPQPQLQLQAQPSLPMPIPPPQQQPSPSLPPDGGSSSSSSSGGGGVGAVVQGRAVPINKGFEDIELQLLARYLVYIAVTVSDFSAVDHSLWRTRALEMPKDRDR